MANIRVTCPTCKSELEIDAAHEGREVECGNCLQVFVPERPGAKGARAPVSAPPKKAGDRPAGKRRRSDDDDDRARSRRRRDEDDEDDYFAPPPPRRSGTGGDGVAVAALVLGIIGLVLVCCYPLSLPLGFCAAVTGALGLKSPNNQAMAIVGMVLGIITLGIAGSFVFGAFGPGLFGRWFR